MEEKKRRFRFAGVMAACVLIAAGFLYWRAETEQRAALALDESAGARPGTDWRELSTPVFRVDAPPGWTAQSTATSDGGNKGTLAGKAMTLNYSCGGPEVRPAPPGAHGASMAQEIVDGNPAIVVKSKTAGQGETAVYFRQFGPCHGLTIAGDDLTAEQQQLALTIFRSIEDKNPTVR